MRATARPLDLPRFTAHELATLHERHPREQEIIAEGSVDRCVVGWFLQTQGIDLPVYDVASRVEVPPELLGQLGLSYGNRSLSIAAATELARIGKLPTDSVLFVIDADYGYTLDAPPPAGPNLLVTDYTDIEMYCFDAQVLRKYLSITLRCPDIDPQVVLDSIEESLSDLYAVRRYLQQLPEPRPEIAARITNRLSITNGRVALDSLGLLRASVSNSLLLEVKRTTNDELREGFQEIRSHLTGDARFRIRGHDYPVVLSYYLSVMHSNCFNNDRRRFGESEVAAGALLACLDPAYLLSKPLFVELLKRVQKFVPYGQ
jgi:hypothetical protein